MFMLFYAPTKRFSQPSTHTTFHYSNK